LPLEPVLGALLAVRRQPAGGRRQPRRAARVRLADRLPHHARLGRARSRRSRRDRGAPRHRRRRAAVAPMELAAGSLAGALSGALGAIAFALVQITAKRLRNAALVRRGLPPYRDVILVLFPFLLAFGVLGALAGALAAALFGAWWPASALAGTAAPALLAAVVVVFATMQALERPGR